MEFNQNSNSSLKSRVTKKKSLLQGKFNQQGIKTNYNSPTDLSKEKNLRKPEPSNKCEISAKLKLRASLWVQQNFPRVVFPLRFSCCSRAPRHVRPAVSWGHVRPPDRNSLVHYKHLACLSLGGGGKHGPGLSRVGKGSMSLHALRPTVTQDIVVYGSCPNGQYVIVWSVQEPEVRRTAAYTEPSVQYVTQPVSWIQALKLGHSSYWGHYSLQ